MEDLISWIDTFTPLFQLVLAVSAILGIGAYLLRWAIKPLDEKLSNHITDTHKEIAKTNQEIAKTNQALAKTNQKIDKIEKAGQERDKKLDRILQRLEG